LQGRTSEQVPHSWLDRFLRSCDTLAKTNDIYGCAFIGTQAAECALKAICVRNGHEEKALRRTHDLEKLWALARAARPGLGPVPAWLDTLKDAHASYQLRYHDKVHGMQFPGAAVIAEGLRALVTQMELSLA